VTETRGSHSWISRVVIASAQLSFSAFAPAAVMGLDVAPPIPKVYDGDRLLRSEAVAVELLESTQACRLMGRLSRWLLAAQLGR
jgi:hypothetical protein